MKDFGIKIDDVKLDRYTQDSRLIKMKIWLHFTKLFLNKDLMKEHDVDDSGDELEDEESFLHHSEESHLETTKMTKLHPIH